MSPLSSPCQQTVDHFSSTYKLGYSYSYNNKFHKTRLCHFLVQNIWAIAEKNCTFFRKKIFVRIPVATPTLINYIYLRSAINTLYLQHIKSSIFRTFKIALECLTSVQTSDRMAAVKSLSYNMKSNLGQQVRDRDTLIEQSS